MAPAARFRAFALRDGKISRICLHTEEICSGALRARITHTDPSPRDAREAHVTRALTRPPQPRGRAAPHLAAPACAHPQTRPHRPQQRRWWQRPECWRADGFEGGLGGGAAEDELDGGSDGGGGQGEGEGAPEQSEAEQAAEAEPAPAGEPEEEVESDGEEPMPAARVVATVTKHRVYHGAQAGSLENVWFGIKYTDGSTTGKGGAVGRRRCSRRQRGGRRSFGTLRRIRASRRPSTCRASGELRV